MGDLTATGFETEQWAGGQPKARWYDKYGHTYILPADPYSIEHYQDRGLSLHPPESPVPSVEDNPYLAASRGDAPIPGSAPASEIERLEQVVAQATAALAAIRAQVPDEEPVEESRKGRGPDKKPRRKRRKTTAPNQRVGKSQ